MLRGGGGLDRKLANCCHCWRKGWHDPEFAKGVVPRYYLGMIIAHVGWALAKDRPKNMLGTVPFPNAEVILRPILKSTLHLSFFRLPSSLIAPRTPGGLRTTAWGDRCNTLQHFATLFAIRTASRSPIVGACGSTSVKNRMVKECRCINRPRLACRGGESD